MKASTFQSLGGSGEESRNCFLVNTSLGSIMLDCGVRREISNDPGRIYPAITRKIAESIKQVFISHAHEDHIAALPYLYALGYSGPVYATEETINLAYGAMRKWFEYARDEESILPYEEDDMNRINFKPISLGKSKIGGMDILTGRSGHIIGGVWYRFTIEGKTLLYTGDYTCDSITLQADALPQADNAVMECAYAGKTLNQSEQYGKLLASVTKTIESGGKAFLPVPSNGRGVDMLSYLNDHNASLYIEKAISDSVHRLLSNKKWLKDGVSDHMKQLKLKPISTEEERTHAISRPEGTAILAPDGMITSKSSIWYYNKLKDDKKNKIIISGHASKGTLGAKVLQLNNGIAAAAESIIIKVHPDECDLSAMVEEVKPRNLMLFHAEASSCLELIESLRRRGIHAVCSLKDTLKLS